MTWQNWENSIYVRCVFSPLTGYTHTRYSSWLPGLLLHCSVNNIRQWWSSRLFSLDRNTVREFEACLRSLKSIIYFLTSLIFSLLCAFVCNNTIVNNQFSSFFLFTLYRIRSNCQWLLRILLRTVVSNSVVHRTNEKKKLKPKHEMKNV